MNIIILCSIALGVSDIMNIIGEILSRLGIGGISHNDYKETVLHS